MTDIEPLGERIYAVLASLPEDAWEEADEDFRACAIVISGPPCLLAALQKTAGQ